MLQAVADLHADGHIYAEREPCLFRAERRNIVDSKGQQDIQLTLLPPPNMQAGPLNISLEQVRGPLKQGKHTRLYTGLLAA